MAYKIAAPLARLGPHNDNKYRYDEHSPSPVVTSVHLPSVIARSEPVSRYTERATKQSR